MPREKERTIVTIDPSLQYARSLHYRERHSAWEIYKAVYWGLYVFVIGLLLMTTSQSSFVLVNFVGVALVLFALFFVVYGFSISMHLKLIKKYG